MTESTSPPSSTAAVPATVFAESTPLGLLGLAVGCAALLPIAFGQAMTPAAFRTAALYCLLFGGGCQFLAGIMALANKNLLGGTLFTTFAFNWLVNWQVLSGYAEGRAPDPHIVLSIDCCFMLIFFVLTFAFGFYSKLLFAFLLDIDVLFASRILKELTHSQAFAMPIAWATVLLGLIALYLAFAILLNTAAGRQVLKIPGPLFAPTASTAGASPAAH
jgi:succinate-acetate transporter protein